MSIITLRRFFERDFSPIFTADWSPATFDAYRGTLSKWELHSHNPPLPAIDSRALAAFKRAAAESLSAATVNKHLRHVHHLLAKAGPPGYHNRDALGILRVAPWTKPLREIEGDPRLVTEDELVAFLHVCRRARLPRLDGINAADWWRSLTIAAFCLAARRGTLLALKWAHVDVANRWIAYDGSIDKARRRRRKRIHPVLVPHLLRIRSVYERVFPWPHSDSTYYREFRRLVALADLDDAWHLHDLKKSAASRGSATMDLFALKEFCDHATIRTTEKHYATARDRVGAAVDAMQMPTVFAESFAAHRQRLLF